jgi:hypothetical protein
VSFVWEEMGGWRGVWIYGFDSEGGREGSHCQAALTDRRGALVVDKVNGHLAVLTYCSHCVDLINHYVDTTTYPCSTSYVPRDTFTFTFRIEILTLIREKRKI